VQQLEMFNGKEVFEHFLIIGSKWGLGAPASGGKRFWRFLRFCKKNQF